LISGRRFVCALDLGMSKVRIIIANCRSSTSLEIIGSGYALSEGFNDGYLIDINSASESIRKAASIAELDAVAAAAADWIILGLSGDLIAAESANHHGSISIQSKRNEITTKDVAEVVRQAASSCPIQPNRETIHVLPQEFFVDGHGRIENPVGIIGSRLEVDLHVVTADKFLVQNFVNVVNRAGIRVRRIIISQLAAAEAVLNPYERKQGVLVIEMGRVCTNMTILLRNAVRYTCSLRIGGDDLTKMLAQALQMNQDDAEYLKKEHGSLVVEQNPSDEIIHYADVSGKLGIANHRIAFEILNQGIEGMVTKIKDTLHRWEMPPNQLTGVVLTGGACRLDGMTQTIEARLKLPVRIGVPQGIGGLREHLSTPEYSTSVGLALISHAFGVRNSSHERFDLYPDFIRKFLSWIRASV
jgi:cell division protein FtsA